MASILILIGAHLCTAPRPQKEADTLTAAGHEVMVAGVWFDPELVKRDLDLLASKPWKFYPVLDFRPGQPSRFGVRLQARLARQLYRWLQLKSPALLGYGARRLLQFAQTYRADLTIVHSEGGLWVGQHLLRQGYAVGVDFEDWFSQDLLPSARQIRPTGWLARLEATLLKGCTYRLAPSQAMAQAMAETYQVSPPTALYNVFPAAEQNPAQGSPSGSYRPLRLHWFSQTIGPGRGLELLFAALPDLTVEVEIHLRGHCSTATHLWLTHQIPPEWEPYIYVHPTVPNAELPARIAENDIGLALETNTIPSRDLTVTNKLFQYMQAGLAIIASDTAGQREVFSRFPAMGQLISGRHPRQLAAAITHFVEHPDQLQAAKTAALKAAQTTFCWELEAQKLRSLVAGLGQVNQVSPNLLTPSPTPPFPFTLAQSHPKP